MPVMAGTLSLVCSFVAVKVGAEAEAEADVKAVNVTKLVLAATGTSASSLLVLAIQNVAFLMSVVRPSTRLMTLIL